MIPNFAAKGEQRNFLLINIGTYFESRTKSPAFKISGEGFSTSIDL